MGADAAPAAGRGGDALVSAVVPIYNSEKFLADAIESVIAQTYDRWELVLVDDGSADGSAAIARRYSERLGDKVRCLRHPGGENRGCAASRNLGVREARGEYVAFLDADDVWLPGKLDRQVALLRAHPEAAMTYGPSRWWYGWTGRTEDEVQDFVQDLGVPPGMLVRPPALLALFLRDGTTVPIPASVMVRREVVQRLGFEESFRGLPKGLYEDQTFFAKITLAESSLPTADVDCWYRQHPDAVTAIARKARVHAAARLAFLTWLEGYLSARGATRGEVWDMVRKELWRRRHPRLARSVARARRAPNRLYRELRGLPARVLPARLQTWLRARR